MNAHIFCRLFPTASLLFDVFFALNYISFRPSQVWSASKGKIVLRIYWQFIIYCLITKTLIKYTWIICVCMYDSASNVCVCVLQCGFVWCKMIFLRFQIVKIGREDNKFNLITEPFLFIFLSYIISIYLAISHIITFCMFFLFFFY